MRKQNLYLFLVFFCSMALTLPAHAQATGKATGKVWALLVGVSKYQNPQISTLRFPASDATGIQNALTDKELGGLPATNVKLLTDDQATAANILGAVDTFLKPNVKPGDQVVIFLAGHGVAKGVGLDAKSFLLSSDVKGLTTAALEDSAVNLRKLSDKVGALPASQFVVFVDACREDPTPGRGVKGNVMSDVLSRGAVITPQDTTRPASSASFFACSIGQRAFEDPAFNHGVFTYWILEGIRTAAAARKPDGAIDMGVLSSYVKTKVSSWAKQASDKGDFEIEQTPEFVTSELHDPIILMRVKKPLPAKPLTADSPQVTVLSDPPGAQVTLDGQKIGAAPLTHEIPTTGEHTVKVEASGYGTLEKKVTALNGYDLVLTMSSPPDGRSAGPALELYRKAQAAEASQQWEVAEAGYTAVIAADNKFAPAYEQLANIRRNRGRLRPAIETLTQMVANTPQTAHGLSLLSTAYAELSLQEAPLRNSVASTEEKKSGGGGGLAGKLFGKKGGGGGPKEVDFKGGPKTYVVPKDWKDAAILSKRAADAAIALDANSADANRALGFGLMVTDNSNKNKEDAMAAFGKALFIDGKDAANHYGLGYGIRYFSGAIKDETERNAELDRAIASLKKALELRPAYYEAHRELAYCYHIQEKDKEAQHEYESANANRGAASNSDEVAAINLSLAGLYREMANNASGDTKAGLLAASAGYFGDAKDITPNLEAAMRILTRAQLSTRLVDYMPTELQKFLDLPSDLRSKLNLPGVPNINLPGFP